MSFLTAAVIGLAVAGTALTVAGQQQQIAGQRRAEDLRRQQMELEATRRKREIVRQGILARSQALATATAQGAGQSSGLPGAYGQIAGQVGRAETATNQNLEIGRGIFDANAQALSGKSLESMGGGLTSLSSNITNNYGAITRIGRNVMRPTPISSSTSFGD